ncbi:MAG TPA: phosphoribosylglycinamide formyltransferase [Piscinibacter sp.]|jgi:phosphoribosylglycinamide formyltransferase-1|uniref:phosphoribosylglycinamide formyltransferase n=1 Tax=Piscinibacter sp. TaxID=1903157 RepID=UPI0011D98D5C|nr:phosphoribosylglycinamide formyltransferase [Piscinibacter sp.]TXH54529.1 MAG: phosphoribosylglycinamide formyltransferase [Burkholderiaceae bacterium]MBP5991998.1 phosphoribosylglycinamide formyltransferase [Piscinibacter sp.]MBP6029452.1 phosphoribosylglycinamide formyltransferase [Piscinibacter sp.]HNJ82305.1 phosphoribosylglycinamide formyltransferase [Piscinibacter sp.]HNK18512.1 phosphoribosylglycinamide formyltransferase [Piscinibacter sp.]
MKNIVVLISGRGSNMESIVQACATEGWNARIAAVVSNQPDAAGLAFARARGIATAVVDHRGHASRESFDAELQRTIDAFAPDLLVLAGFMRILTPGFVSHYAGRLLNVHPSLLPAFTGLHTHRRALEAGCKAAGATVHFVTADLDHGPIIAQAVVPVLPGDSEETLAARVLAREHVLYPRAVRWFVDDLLRVEGSAVRHVRGEPQLLLA